MSFLRPYQIECRQAVIDELSNGSTSTLYVMPTGLGKTEVGMSLIEEWPDQDCDILWLAHREELVYQPWERWRRRHGEYCEMEMGEYRRSGNGHRITFASKDSLHPGRLKKAFPDPRRVGLIVCDEAHHLAKQNESYQHIVRYFADSNPDFRLAGCTATPDRTDESALGQTFDSVAFDFPLFDPDGGPSAIGDGWLVPIEQEYIVVDELKFEQVGSRGGDFIDSQLQKMILEDKGLYRITAATRELAGGATTLCFTAGIDMAIGQAGILNAEQDGSAFCIVSRVDKEKEYDFVLNSRDKDARRRALKRWGSGEFQFLSNVGVFTEGMDEPSIGCISMGRPTKSRSLYAQMAGRGTRILPGTIEGDGWRLDTPEERKAAIAASGKPSILILDFVGNSRHSLISSVDILGGRYEDDVVQRAKERIGNRQNVQEALEEAQREISDEMEKRRRIRAKAEAVSRQKVDPFSIAGVVPTREPGWHKGRKPTPGQKRALEKFRLDKNEIERLSFWEANKMLDKLIKNAKEGKCTYKQRKLLVKHGFNPEMSFAEARVTIDQIASSGWKLKGPHSEDAA
jgi:superfamily II DNA or RNA helicase